ncbi:MAG: hypothetical protein HY707_07490 [Ignavibacteriae bacterium]|nr:hypothetical protein [Ignavibacteriota bacterium]
MLFIFTSQSLGQEETDTLPPPRPFIRGGVYDKPFVTRLFGKTALGGYMEAVWKLEREQGVTEEVTFEARRFNIFLHSALNERTRVFAELEFEHGTEEIAMEFAALDFEIHPMLIFRGGIILSPLGKFNLTHDSPLNELTDRPLVSTQIIPTALSEAGIGFYGAFYPSEQSRITYEVYGVNGFNDGIVLSDGEGTRIREGRGDVGEDNNPAPSFVGRVAYSPNLNVELGASFHTGPYNRYKVDEFTIDERRNLTIVAFDWELTTKHVDLLGEYAFASINVVPSLRELFAERQQGVYGQVNYRFGHGWFTTLPHSHFTAIARYEFVDFDADLKGDGHQRLSLGVNFRPVQDTVFKLDYYYNWMWSRVDVLERGAGVNFSVASYF